MIPPHHAWIARRLLFGHTLNGELRNLSGPFKNIIDHLAKLLPEARHGAWDGFLCARPDREDIIKALAAVDPTGPGPEPGMEDEDGGSGLATTCLADIPPEPIRWLVPGYLPLGKLDVLAGEGGYGKTTLTLHLIACVTRGWPCFGLAYAALPPADVLLVSCEDDYADTVVPRLMAAGADLRRVYRVDGIEPKDGRPGVFTLAHLDQMERELRRRPSVRLVVIDPVSGYIGRAGVDDNREGELRSVLDPMAELAARRSVLVLMVKHLSKDQTRKAAQRVGGSAAYVNASRSAYIVAPDPDDRDRRLFLPVKFNCGPWPPGLAFRMEALPADEQAGILAGMDHLGAEDRERLARQLYRTAWLGPVDISADEALGTDTRRKPATADADKAAEWLKERLRDGPVGSVQAAREGNTAIGRRPHPLILADVKWWRESVLKARLGGKPRKLGKDDAVWFFTILNQPWPPSDKAIRAARRAAAEASAGSSEGPRSREQNGLFDPEEPEGSEGSGSLTPDSSGTVGSGHDRRIPPEPGPLDPDSLDPSGSSGQSPEGEVTG